MVSREVWFIRKLADREGENGRWREQDILQNTAAYKEASMTNIDRDLLEAEVGAA